MHITHIISKSVIVMLILLVTIPATIFAEENASVDTLGENEKAVEPASGLLYNGSIDTTGSVLVSAESDKSYNIPGNTPIGVLESLRESGKIKGYILGDELMEKKDILLIDEIGGLKYGNESGWFVKVNGERLEDVVLADVMGLNKYILKEGDVVLYALGNPDGMVSESVAYLTVTIGKAQETPVVTKETETDAINETSSSSKVNVFENNENNVNVEEEEQETNENETDKPVQTSSGSPGILYNGSLSLPSGSVNITTTGGDYDINAATPLGILQELLKDDRISSISVSDKGMQKGGILVLEGINEYQFSGDKTWFVTVNGVVLKDYYEPDTDGLNIYKINSGDDVGYFFGEPSKPVKEAEVSINISIE